ncbi:MAG: neutral zinc metallopeptidase [bacterium]|nr:neutral zinc metallopeptidase [bacterium]
MADWSKILSRGNVEDRRAYSPATIGGGFGIAGIALVLLLNYLSTGQINVDDVLNQLQEVQVQNEQSYNKADFEGTDSYEVFASTVLGSTNDMWAQVFAQKNMEYQAPRLVLFRSATQSACSGADSRVGPHYCSLDQTIYLDETFFDELQKLGGEGDVAQAYVLAHEVGHNVQNQLGILDTESTPDDSVTIELQADCFAGLWAYSIRDLGVIAPGEINEAMDAAAAVGDDRIQATYTGRITPETWTHGSSEERVRAFNNGFQSGALAACM